MFEILFRCAHCRSSLSVHGSALCGICREVLDLNRLDDFFVSELWVESEKVAVFQAYRLFPDCYQILRTWKKRRHPRFNREVLRFDPNLLIALRAKNFQAIVPVPHTLSRTRELGGDPIIALAQSLSNALRIPVLPALHRTDRNAPIRHGKLGAIERRLTEMPVALKDRIALPKSILIVDDFITTGETARLCAKRLSESGGVELAFFCLGRRQLSLNLKTSSNLLNLLK